MRTLTIYNQLATSKARQVLHVNTQMYQVLASTSPSKASAVRHSLKDSLSTHKSSNSALRSVFEDSHIPQSLAVLRPHLGALTPSKV